MKIIDLNQENKHLYFVCLEDWSDEMKEAGNHKECWYNKMKDKGLRIKFAADDNGVIGGMIHYLPIEHSIVEGKNLFFINCIWVHGYKEGRGNFRKKGMGKALIKAAEEDAKNLGAKGIAAWGLAIPVWMKASWFKKQGYVKTDKQSIQVLLWKKFTEDAEPPKWIKPKKPEIQFDPEKVTITAYKNGWCPAYNIAYERVKKAAEEFPGKVIFNTVDTLDKKIILSCGRSDEIYIEKKQIVTGPPPSYKKILKTLKKAIHKKQN
ncbi:MAG: GNAT family N-acetyltransferase [Bacteroidales bacterium]|nr:GNAT family N-acetyltransferase [Bacteroidales bacterium]